MKSDGILIAVLLDWQTAIFSHDKLKRETILYRNDKTLSVVNFIWLSDVHVRTTRNNILRQIYAKFILKRS